MVSGVSLVAENVALNEFEVWKTTRATSGWTRPNGKSECGSVQAREVKHC